jgi:imidazolonepropionase-like amidohydrolase
MGAWLCLATGGRTASSHEVYAIRSARVVTGAGQTLDKANVVMRDGVIVGVGANAEIPFDADVLDGEGLTVYAGFIDANANVGLTLPEPQPNQDTPPDTMKDAAAAMRVANRRGVRPELLAAQYLTLNADGGNPHRQAGFTTALIAPSGGLLTGQSALVNLSGATRREVIVKTPVAQHAALSMGGGGFGGGGGGGGYPGTLMGIMAHLRQTLLDAQRYRLHWDKYQHSGGVRRPPLDDALAALLPVLDGATPVMSEADTENDIKRVLALAKEFNLKVILSGCTEGWKVADLLAKEKIPVILSLGFGAEPADPDRRPPTPPTAPPQDAHKGLDYDVAADGSLAPRGRLVAYQEQTPPSPGGAGGSRQDEDPYRVRKDRRLRWEERVANAAQLHKAGVVFSFTTKGVGSPTEFLTNLEKAVTAGLPRDAALRALTATPAEWFGVSQHLGRVEVGKLANLVVMSGELAARNAKVRAVFIDGKRFDFDAKTSAPRTPPAAGVNLTGEWTLSFTTPMGEREMTLTLRQAPNGDLTGDLKTEQGAGRITDAYVSGTQVKFTLELTFGGRAVPLEATGTVQGNTMNGTLNTRFGEATWRATKKPSA